MTRPDHLKAKLVVSMAWVALLFITFFISIITAVLTRETKWRKTKSFWRFLHENARESGVNKKVIRTLDTTATILALAGLVIGLTGMVTRTIY